MKSLLLAPSVKLLLPLHSFIGIIDGTLVVPSTTVFSFNPRRFSRSRPLLSFRSHAMASPVSQSSQTAAPGDGSGTSDVFQLIQAHQAAVPNLPPLEQVRTVLDNTVRGALSTFSQNLIANPKCSLLVAKNPEDRNDIVITLFGDAVSVLENDREAARTAYLRKHPDAFWVDFGDFRFIQIKPKFVHYVSGVATALLGSGDFNAEEFKSAKVDPISQFSVPVISHMNKDHAEDTKAIVQHSTSIKVEFAHMLDVDSLGFNVKAGYQGNTFKLRIPFSRQAHHRKDVKNLIVEMLQAARASV